jgi:hypothetical protein
LAACYLGLEILQGGWLVRGPNGAGTVRVSCLPVSSIRSSFEGEPKRLGMEPVNGLHERWLAAKTLVSHRPSARESLRLFCPGPSSCSLVKRQNFEGSWPARSFWRKSLSVKLLSGPSARDRSRSACGLLRESNAWKLEALALTQPGLAFIETEGGCESRRRYTHKDQFGIIIRPLLLPMLHQPRSIRWHSCSASGRRLTECMLRTRQGRVVELFYGHVSPWPIPSAPVPSEDCLTTNSPLR